MTVSDLITLLSAQPPDLLVCFPRDEGGFSPIQGLYQGELLLNVNPEYWYGPHDYPESIPESEAASYQKELCIILVR